MFEHRPPASHHPVFVRVEGRIRLVQPLSPAAFLAAHAARPVAEQRSILYAPKTQRRAVRPTVTLRAVLTWAVIALSGAAILWLACR